MPFTELITIVPIVATFHLGPMPTSDWVRIITRLEDTNCQSDTQNTKALQMKGNYDADFTSDLNVPDDCLEG